MSELSYASGCKPSVLRLVCSPHAQMVPVNRQAQQLLSKLFDQGLPADAFAELLDICETVLPELQMLLQHLPE